MIQKPRKPAVSARATAQPRKPRPARKVPVRTPAQEVVTYAFERDWLCDASEKGAYVVVKGGHAPVRVPLDLPAERVAEFKKVFHRAPIGPATRHLRAVPA